MKGQVSIIQVGGEGAPARVYAVPLLYPPCEAPGLLKVKLRADFPGKKYKPGLHRIV